MILLDYQNNYVGNSNMMSNVGKNFDIFNIQFLNVPYIYLFLNLYLAKFFNILAKLFFPCININ